MKVQHLTVAVLLLLLPGLAFAAHLPALTPSSLPAHPAQDDDAVDQDAQDAETEGQEIEGGEAKEDKKAAEEKKRRAVWDLHASAVADRLRFSEDVADKFTEAYVDARSRLHFMIEDEHAEWRKQQAEALREARSRGSTAGLFDQSELRRRFTMFANTARSRFAKVLVEMLERPQAEKAYAALAGFDAKIDGLIRLIAGYELDEKKTFAAIQRIEEYFSATVEAKQRARESRKAYNDAIKRARERLVSALKRDLTEEQLAEFSRRVGIRPPRKR